MFGIGIGSLPIMRVRVGNLAATWGLGFFVCCLFSLCLYLVCRLFLLLLVGVGVGVWRH